MFINYFKTAWRSIFKHKATALINITGLSVGMTAAVLILLWVQNEINFDNNHPDADKVFRLTTSIKENNWIWETTPLLLANAAKKVIPEIEKVSRLYAYNQPVFNVNGNLTYEKKCAYVDDDWFNLFQYDFIKGNAASFAQDLSSIILTASAAKKYLGNQEAIGATIRIDSMNFQVKAIVKDAPVNSSFQYQAFMPLAALLTDAQRRENDENWSNFNYITFIKLKPGSNPFVTAKKLTNVLPDNKKEGTTISLISLKEMHFENGLKSSAFMHGNRNTVYIFSILAFLLLLIACINYVNLTTAKASLRAKEVSVRKMVGAKRIHLFYQFIAESLLISFMSLITTLVLIHFCLPSFNSVTDKNFVLTLTSVSMWGVIVITLFAALLLNSIYYQSLHDKTGALIAFNDPKWFTFFMVRIAPNNASQAVKAIQNIWKRTLPGKPLEYNFLDDTFNKLYKEDLQTSILIFVFSMIAIVISALGLFGLTAFTAEQRTKEIGIRKVLGATAGNITAMLSKDFVKLVFIAILIASPIAFWAMNKWIQNFAYRIEITWWIFIAAGLITLIIALVTVSFQAIKAAVANPVKSLRTE